MVFNFDPKRSALKITGMSAASCRYHSTANASSKRPRSNRWRERSSSERARLPPHTAGLSTASCRYKQTASRTISNAGCWYPKVERQRERSISKHARPSLHVAGRSVASRRLTPELPPELVPNVLHLIGDGRGS